MELDPPNSGMYMGSQPKKEKCFENLRITRNAQDGNYCAVNPKFLAVVVEVGGGGSFVVLPLSASGRIDYNVWKVTGHAGPVLDVKWNPFNDNIIASGSEDSMIRVWLIPDGGLRSDLKDCMMKLKGHRRKVGIIEWHPTAENILASAGFDHLVIIWNITNSVPVNIINCHVDTIFSISFNRNGSLLATTSKDKMLRILDPRSGKLVQEGRSHPGTKVSKVVYLGATGKLLTTGFSKFSDRQLAIWSEKDLSQPLTLDTIDSSSGILTPYYDPDTSMVYMAGKGDGNVRYYQLLNEAPWVYYLNELITGAPQKGFGIMPKRGIDASACEVFRLYKLHATKDAVEPISMIVPRKSNIFQADLYPDTAAPAPAIKADQWLQGETAWPVLMSIKTGVLARRDNREQADDISDKNNDRKLIFLSKETNPDYRQVKEVQSSSENNYPTSGADKIQTKEFDKNNLNVTATDKDIKTSLNLGKKFQQIHGNIGYDCYNHSDNETKAENGSNIVAELTSKFDSIERKENTNTKTNLKQVVKEQGKLISNLKDQVGRKDQRIRELEEKVKLLLSKNQTTAVTMSMKLTSGQSCA